MYGHGNWARRNLVAKPVEAVPIICTATDAYSWWLVWRFAGY